MVRVSGFNQVFAIVFESELEDSLDGFVDNEQKVVEEDELDEA